MVFPYERFARLKFKESISCRTWAVPQSQGLGTQSCPHRAWFEWSHWKLQATQRDQIDDPYGSLPIQGILWFYEIHKMAPGPKHPNILFRSTNFRANSSFCITALTMTWPEPLSTVCQAAAAVARLTSVAWGVKGMRKHPRFPLD